MPTYRQHAEGIFAMVHDLQDLDMSKGEILQVVNTIPTSEVEVYTVSHTYNAYIHGETLKR